MYIHISDIQQCYSIALHNYFKNSRRCFIIVLDKYVRRKIWKKNVSERKFYDLEGVIVFTVNIIWSFPKDHTEFLKWSVLSHELSKTLMIKHFPFMTLRWQAKVKSIMSLYTLSKLNNFYLKDFCLCLPYFSTYLPSVTKLIHSLYLLNINWADVVRLFLKQLSNQVV